MRASNHPPRAVSGGLQRFYSRRAAPRTHTALSPARREITRYSTEEERFELSIRLMTDSGFRDRLFGVPKAAPDKEGGKRRAGTRMRLMTGAEVAL